MKALKLELGVGVHLFGNSTTLTAVKGRIDLEVTEAGVMCRHLEQRKAILVPFSNVKAVQVEFYNDQGQLSEPVKTKTRR